MKFNALFGESLFDATGRQVATEVLQNHVVLVYFSASWCRPCAAFTPQLIALRERVIAQMVPFEVVFVSSDRDEAQFNAYFAKMPWLAPPYDADRSAKIGDKFKVTSIPYAAVLFPNNTAMTRDVVRTIQQDPTGQFIVNTWRTSTGVVTVPPAAASGPSLQTLLQQLEYVPAERTGATRAKQFLAFYISNDEVDAGLKDELLRWYSDTRTYGAPDFTEVVFIPLNKPTSAAFQAGMPWVTVRSQDPLVRMLLQTFLKSVPALALVIVDQRAGKVVCVDGAARLSIDGAHFPWANSAWKPFEAVKDRMGTVPLLILLLDTPDQALVDVFSEAARALRDAASNIQAAICDSDAHCAHFCTKLGIAPKERVLYFGLGSWAAYDAAAPVSVARILEFCKAQEPLPLPF